MGIFELLQDNCGRQRRRIAHVTRVVFGERHLLVQVAVHFPGGDTCPCKVYGAVWHHHGPRVFPLLCTHFKIIPTHVLEEV